MATELDRRCPICLDTMDDASHVMPCLHRFCFGCIQRWAESRPTCPLCKRRVGSILHSVRADDSFEEVVVRQQERARTAPHHATPAEDQPGAQLPVPSTAAISEGPSQPPSLPAPLRPSQQAAQEEPGEAVPGPSSTNRARERSRRAPRRAPKRRAHNTEASAPPAKRPPRRQR